MTSRRKGPPWGEEQDWPKCHFRYMTLHSSCSDMSGHSDGYECDFCGHTLSLIDWIESQNTKKESKNG